MAWDQCLIFKELGRASFIVALNYVGNVNARSSWCLVNHAITDSFGFRRGSDLGFQNEYQADDAFMVLELRKEGLPTEGGLVRDASEFAELQV